MENHKHDQKSSKCEFLEGENVSWFYDNSLLIFKNIQTPYPVLGELSEWNHNADKRLNC